MLFLATIWNISHVQERFTFISQQSIFHVSKPERIGVEKLSDIWETAKWAVGKVMFVPHKNANQEVFETAKRISHGICHHIHLTKYLDPVRDAGNDLKCSLQRLRTIHPGLAEHRDHTFSTWYAHARTRPFDRGCCLAAPRYLQAKVPNQRLFPVIRWYW